MRNRSKHRVEEPVERTIGDDLRDQEAADTGADTAQLNAVPGPLAELVADTEPPTGGHGVDPLRAIATLLRIPELRDVTWCFAGATRGRIDGSLLIPAEVDLRPMTPEDARREVERFGSWVAGGGPATVRTTTEARRTRVTVEGVLHGVTVTLSALMPPMDPLTATAPATTEWEPVPEATPVAAAEDSHPYIGPQYARPAAVKPAEKRRRRTTTHQDDETGDNAA